MLLCGLFLAGCAAQKRSTPVGTVFPDGQQCLFELASRGIQASSWNAPQTSQCPVSTPISVARAGFNFEPGLNSSCAMVLQWLVFADRIDQLALRHLGSPIKTVHHLGSYNCRRMRGNSRRMSLHSQARALDIYAFDTLDGQRIRVGDDWRGSGSKSEFLRAFAAASCEHFSVVLTPAHDQAHANHVHVDIGPWRFCGV